MTKDLMVYGAVVAACCVFAFGGLVAALIHATKPLRAPLYREMVRSHRRSRRWAW